MTIFNRHQAWKASNLKDNNNNLDEKVIPKHLDKFLLVGER